MQHQPWEDQIAFYVAGTLPRAQAAELERHIATCATCQQSLYEWKQIAEAVRDEAGAWSRRLPPLSSDVRSNLRQPPARNVSSTSFDAPTPIAHRPRYRAPSRTWGLVTMAAALLTLVLFGGAVAYLTNRDRQIQSASATQIAMALQTEEADATQTAPPSPTRRPATQTPNDLGILSSATATAQPTTLSAPTRIPTQAPDNPLVSTQMLNTGSTNLYMPGNVPTEAKRCRLGSPGEPVPIYQWANLQAPMVDFIQPGELLTSDIADGAGWYQVNGREFGILGWVPADSVIFDGPCNEDLMVPSPTPTIDPTRCTAYASIGQTLFLLEGPGIGWQTTYILQPLTSATAFERSDNGWVRLMREEGSAILIGWVQESELVLEGNVCTTLPVIAASQYVTPDVPLETATFTPTPDITLTPFDLPTDIPPSDVDITEQALTP